MGDKYTKGDRVFAKMKGFSPWPGRVDERVPGKVEAYKIYFYGTYDEATVKIDMLYPYNEENASKYGKNKKARFKEAMQEIADNVIITAEGPTITHTEDDDDEGELQIDEGGPPILKREVSTPVLKMETESAPVPVAKAIPKRVSKGKRDSGSGRSTPTVAVVNTPEPVAPPPQVEVVSRSGRKIKPKRFADDEIPSSTPNGRRDSDGKPPNKRMKLSTPKAKVEEIVDEVKETPVRGKGKGKGKEVEKIPTPTEKGPRGGVGKKGLPPPPKLLQISTIPAKKSSGTDKGRPPPLLTKPELEKETSTDKQTKVDSTPHNQTKAESSDKPEFTPIAQRGQKIQQNSENPTVEMKHVPLETLKGDELLVSVKMDNKGNLSWERATARNLVKIKSELAQSELDSLDILAVSTGKPDLNGTGGNYSEMQEPRKLSIEEVAKLRIEGEVIEIIGEIVSALGSDIADCDRVMELLERLSGHEVDILLLKKHPEVVETIRKLRHYVGNCEEWKFNAMQKNDFSVKANDIRDKSNEIYDGFKSLFCSDESKAFQLQFVDEVAKFKNCTNGLQVKTILSLGEDPTTMENPEKFLERHRKEVEMKDEDETSEEEVEDEFDEEVEDEEEFGDENYLEGYDDMEDEEEEGEAIYPNNQADIM